MVVVTRVQRLWYYNYLSEARVGEGNGRVEGCNPVHGGVTQATLKELTSHPWLTSVEATPATKEDRNAPLHPRPVHRPLPEGR